jgi:hypothetical protein
MTAADRIAEIEAICEEQYNGNILELPFELQNELEQLGY